MEAHTSEAPSDKDETKPSSKRAKTKEDPSEDRDSKSPAKSPAKGKKGVKSDLSATPEKVKNSDEKAECNASEASNTTLTPEMQERIQKNKQQALEKRKALEAKSGGSKASTMLEAAQELPDSWKDVLSPELSKSYFKSLDAFVR